ncbi:hypothetical protein SDC9_212120 [bioreactor metagenome]|uniref:Uncharacterized protein n=1 Tax=bioreactor metagenome TaxID=1076179 RepID=A0A645JKZ4_9ZZZZ
MRKFAVQQRPSPLLGGRRERVVVRVVVWPAQTPGNGLLHVIGQRFKLEQRKRIAGFGGIFIQKTNLGARRIKPIVETISGSITRAPIGGF